MSSKDAEKNAPNYGSLESLSSEDLSVQCKGGVVWLTITREARRNAMSHQVLERMGNAIDAAQFVPSLRAMVITGEGEKAFCSGADLQAASPFAADGSAALHGKLAQVLRAARRSHIPLVARVNGACMAGGMGLLSMCDMAVAAKHAIFGLPEVKVGVFPAQVLTALQHLIPRRKLVEMCITGEPLTSEDALALGLVNYVDDDVDARVDWLLKRLNDKSPQAIRRGLYTLKAIDGMDFEQSMAFTESQIALFAMTQDAKEGQQAFIEKRPPKWTL